ncbi:MAG: hypothetical protein ACYCSQ_00470 [bacterium]
MGSLKMLTDFERLVLSHEHYHKVMLRNSLPNFRNELRSKIESMLSKKDFRNSMRREEAFQTLKKDILAKIKRGNENN